MILNIFGATIFLYGLFFSNDFHTLLITFLCFLSCLLTHSVKSLLHSDKYEILEETAGKLAQDIVDLRGQVSILKNRFDR